jgi:hypothetical protein
MHPKIPRGLLEEYAAITDSSVDESSTQDALVAHMNKIVGIYSELHQHKLVWSKEDLLAARLLAMNSILCKSDAAQLVEDVQCYEAVMCRLQEHMDFIVSCPKQDEWTQFLQDVKEWPKSHCETFRACLLLGKHVCDDNASPETDPIKTDDDQWVAEIARNARIKEKQPGWAFKRFWAASDIISPVDAETTDPGSA